MTAATIEDIPKLVRDMMKTRRAYFAVIAFPALALGTLAAVPGPLEDVLGDYTGFILPLALFHLIASAIYLNDRYKSKVANEIMPMLAGELGLSYARSASFPEELFDARILGRNKTAKCEDNLRGTLDGIEISVSELTVTNEENKTGGRHPHFSGLDLTVKTPNVGTFTVRPKVEGMVEKISAFLGSETPVAGNVFEIGDLSFEIDADRADKMDVYREAVKQVATDQGLRARLRGVVQRGSSGRLVFDREGDAFDLGNLLTGEDQTLELVQKVMEDMLEPLNVAKAWHSACIKLSDGGTDRGAPPDQSR